MALAAPRNDAFGFVMCPSALLPAFCPGPRPFRLVLFLLLLFPRPALLLLPLGLVVEEFDGLELLMSQIRVLALMRSPVLVSNRDLFGRDRNNDAACSFLS